MMDILPSPAPDDSVPIFDGKRKTASLIQKHHLAQRVSAQEVASIFCIVKTGPRQKLFQSFGLNCNALFPTFVAILWGILDRGYRYGTT